MNVTLVFIGYAWICFIHSVFAGVTLYSFFGRNLINKNKFLPFLILTAFLAFLEVYWIPVFSKMDVVINVHNDDVVEYFKIDKNTNIVDVLRPSIMSIFIWFAQGLFANYIGKTTYLKIINSLKK